MTIGALMAQVALADIRAQRQRNEIEEPIRRIPCCACDIGQHNDCAGDDEDCTCACR